MMSVDRRQFLLSLAGAGGAWLLASARGFGGEAAAAETAANGMAVVKRTGHAFGTEASIVAAHRDREVLQRALDAAFGRLSVVEDVMSIYRPASQVSHLNRAGQLDAPHEYLVRVLRAAQAMSRATDGAFDITVQPLSMLYRSAAQESSLPDSEAIAETRRLVDWRSLDVTRDAVSLRTPGASITLNGLAQGFAADRVLSVLRGHGVEHALVNTGELAPVGDKSDGSAWIAGIQHPREPEAYAAAVRLDGRCVATSGDYATTFTDDFSRHHILDPKTGLSPELVASVTVVAPRGLQADLLSTAVFVLGPQRGMRLVRATPGADAFLIRKDGTQLATSGFPFETAASARRVGRSA